MNQLVSDYFEVTILNRSRKTDCDLPLGVRVAQVDYNSTDSLVRSLQGHYSVVCTIALEATSSQKRLIDACSLLKLKRYIPADFGSFTTDPNDGCQYLLEQFQFKITCLKRQ